MLENSFEVSEDEDLPSREEEGLIPINPQPDEGESLTMDDPVVKAPVDVLDFSTLTVDQLADRLVDQKILEAVLKKVDLPDCSHASEDAMVPSRLVIDATRRLVEVVAALQSRLVLLETSIASERRVGRGTSQIEPISGEDPTRLAIRKLEQRDVVEVSATDAVFGRNWWPAETLDNLSWRWSGPNRHSTVLVPFRRSRGRLDIDQVS